MEEKVKTQAATIDNKINQERLSNEEILNYGKD